MGSLQCTDKEFVFLQGLPKHAKLRILLSTLTVRHKSILERTKRIEPAGIKLQRLWFAMFVHENLSRAGGFAMEIGVRRRCHSNRGQYFMIALREGKVHGTAMDS